MSLARIGIGANLGDAVGMVRMAIGSLGRYGTVVRASSLYRSKPWGVTDQPVFINAAILLETELTPRELLGELKGLEMELGREPSYRWGPRAIDLDILTYDDWSVDEPDLVVPHPRLHERAFALIPLAEIDPTYAPARDALPQKDRDSVTPL
ncbi:MAG: 2-amino-4-hydroxy-6-hydroxymethyldihydropteridine diphosphokinase [Vulcanimicrobiaceae bacterium]